MGRATIPNDNAQTTLAAGFTAGLSTEFRVLAGKGSLFGTPSVDHPVRLTVTKASAFNVAGQLTDLTKQSVYLATTRAGDILSGLTHESGEESLDFAIGDVIGGLWNAEGARELDEDLAAAEATIASHTATLASHTSSIATLVTDLDAAEATLAEFKPPEVASQAALPVASLSLRGRIRFIPGASGEQDGYWGCVLLSDGVTYQWVQIA